MMEGISFSSVISFQLTLEWIYNDNVAISKQLIDNRNMSFSGANQQHCTRGERYSPAFPSTSPTIISIPPECQSQGPSTM